MLIKKLSEVCFLNRFPELDATSLSELNLGFGSIKLLPSSKDYDWFSTEELCKNHICEGEVITLGKARYANIKYWNGKFVASNNVIIESFDPSILICKYLYYFLFFNVKNFYVEGTTYPKFDNSSFKNTVIKIPSIDEQKKCVELLDNILSGINKSKNEISSINELSKSYFASLFGDVFTNPLDLPKKKLKDVSILITNGNTPKGGSENYVDSGVLFLRSQNVWNNEIVLDNVAYIDKETHLKLKKSSVHFNDILITKTGRYNTENSSLGRAAIFKGEDNSANINGHVYLVRLGDKVIPEFVLYIILGDNYRDYIRHICVGGTDKRQINLDQVEDFPILLPPIEKQQEFVNMILKLENSKISLNKQINFYTELFNKTMEEHFRIGD